MLVLTILSTINSFFSPVDKYIISPLKDHIGYALSYTTKVAELRRNVQTLDGARDNLQNSVDDAGRTGDEIQKNVEKWLGDAEKAIVKAQELIQGEEEANKKRCFAGLCPNLKVRYQLGKKAAEEALAIASLMNEGKFDRGQISYRAPLQQIVTSTVNCFEGLPSREVVLEQVMDAIRDPDVNMIGLHGMGGIGKTTLASEVQGQAIEAELFDVVVMATVSEKPDLRNIQGKIADVLGMELKEETLDGRASRLHQKLKEKEKILVILDNLWAPIELKAIGVPSGVEQKGCKILLTSRNLDVLTSGMGAQKFFKLEPLSEDEAWNLFRATVGNSSTQIMPSLAHQVATKCVGIPLAIVPVAKALRNKEVHAWKVALRQLSMTSKFENRGMQAEVYAALEFSFNHLVDSVGEEVKSLLLLFSLNVFSTINIGDFLKYGVGLGLFEGTGSVEDARNKLLKLIDDLKTSCFLQDTDRGGFVKMHDFVREFAMSIASRDQNAAVVKTAFELKEFAERHIPNSCTRLTLWCRDDIYDLPEDLKCPELDFLLVEGNRSLRIPDSFFSGTRKLKVLDCSAVTFSCLPQSLGLLTSLHTLCLDRCVLPNIAIVGALKKLEILSLLQSDIVELPEEIGQLTQLKLLDLTDCRKLEAIPANFFSKLLQLEELYMRNSFVHWGVKGVNNQSNASLCELEHLSRLTNVEIDFREACKLPKGLFFERLERFEISIGYGWFWFWHESYRTSRTLNLNLRTSIFSWDHGVKTLLKKAEDLYLDEVKGVTNVLYDLDKEGFPQLKHLLIRNSDDVRSIIDSERRLSCDVFPVLKSLILYNLVNLEIICHGQRMATDFCQLKILKVANCNKLKNLFPFSMVKNLKQLHEIEVMDCTDIEEIFTGETEEVNDINEVFEFTQLYSLKLRLPFLRRFCSKVKLTSASTIDPRWPLFNEMIVFPNLKDLKLSSIDVENMWYYQLGDQPSFCNLTSLTVEACQKIKYLFTSPVVRNFGQLQTLEICECKLMEEVIAAEEETISKTSFPKLEFLKLKSLSKLVRFGNSDFIELPSLKKLWTENCPALKSFISNPITSTSSATIALFDKKVALPNLEELHIEDMNGLKMIWHNELNEGSFCKLKTMVIRGAEELVNVFPSNMLMSRFLNLERLDLIDCELLEDVFVLPPHEGLINFSRTHGMPASQLKYLYIQNLPNLKHIWKKDTREREIIFFHKLHGVDVSRCPSLKSIFPTSIATCLQELRELSIGNSGIEEIVDRGEDTETILMFEIPRLTTLALHNLWKLKAVYPGAQTSDLPMLEKLNVHNCPELEIFSLKSRSIGGTGWRSQSENSSQQPFFVREKIFFPNLKDLQLELSSIKVEEIWNSQHMHRPSCFQQLTTLIVDNCENLRHLFTSSMVEYLIQIKRLDICNCKSIEEVVLRQDVGNGESWNKMLFPKVEVLKLEGLPKLTTFCTCRLLECPVLKELQIDNCPQLKSFVVDPLNVDKAPRSQIDDCDSPLFDDKVAFPVVEELTIRNMYWLKTLWHNELNENSFCKLRILTIEHAEALSKVFLSSMLVRRFQNLEQLILKDCESLEEVFDIQGLMISETQAVAASQTRLKTLDIWNLPNLKHVWNEDPREVLSFHNLNGFFISKCPNLRSVFPTSVARGLLQLESLNIDICGIEEIVEKEKGEKKMAPAFVFPKLNSLMLWRLPELKRFYPGKHTSEWPALKVLDVYHCDKMQTLEFQRFQEEEDEEVDGIQVKRSLFTFQEVIPNLEELALTCMEATKIWEGQFAEKLFHNVKYLTLQCFHDKSVVLPCGLLERFPNIQNLFLHCNQRRELFPYGLIGKGKHARPIPQHLRLHYAPNARHARDQDSSIDQLLQNLDVLELWTCDGLTNLAPFSACFQSITSLEIFECQALVHLFTVSMAKTLVQLRKMTIENCDMVTTIVANAEHDTKHEIVFYKLESIELHHLPSLASFCSGRHSFKFPSLTEAIVSQCPEMEIFLKGVLRTPKLQSVKLTQKKDRECWNGDLNTTIQNLYKKMVGFHGLQDLKLINYPNLKDAWHGALPAECFYDLRSLVVEHCASFSNALPSSLLSFLNRLKELDVRNCDSLEEVFCQEGLSANLEHPLLPKLNKLLLSDLPRLRHTWNKDFCGILDFRNLTLLKVHNCSSLKYIFTPTMALSLVQIQELEVKNCTFVGEIITREEEEVVLNTIFSQLNSLVLESLPNLTSFCSTTDVLELQSLEKVTVVDCPRIETFTSTILRAQEPNVVDKNEERLGQEGFSTPVMLLFGSKVTCRSLKELKVEWNNIKDMLHGNFPAECLAKIKVLELTNFPHEETLFPSDILLKLSDMEKLVVNDAHFGELFLQHGMVDKENNDEAVTKLRQLKLAELPKLRQLFQDHSISDLIIQNLETLEIIECVGLKILMSSLLSFQNLTTLKVSKCHGLTKIMTSSTAQSLEKLTRMSITECDMLEEVVASEGNEGQDEIAFSQLKHLTLHCLPNLMGFCSGNHTFNFPSLEEVTLRECSKMRFFSEGALFTPQLTEVQIALNEDQWHWEGSLNTTIHKLFSEIGGGNAQGQH